jgi:hypothetical protein
VTDDEPYPLWHSPGGLLHIRPNCGRNNRPEGTRKVRYPLRVLIRWRRGDLRAGEPRLCQCAVPYVQRVIEASAREVELP